MSKQKLSKATAQPSAPAVALPSKIPYIYPYRLPSGEVRFRVRIRKKTFAGKPLNEPINEVFRTLDEAKKRLFDLEFGKAIEEKNFIAKLFSEGSFVTFKELCDQYYKIHLAKKSNERDYRSRLNVICNTKIASGEARNTKFVNQVLNFSEIADSVKSFGELHVTKIGLAEINKFVDSRLANVKPQTCTNDVILINNILKDGHNLFSNLKQNEEPLAGFNWKRLEKQVEYRDKKLRPENRMFIEKWLIENSRKAHYYEFFLFLYETGCRLSEALTVCYKDIDFTTRTVFMITKKNKRPRYVGLSARLFPILEEKNKSAKPTDRVFPYSKETYEGKLTQMRPHLQARGITFTWHDLRHNYISSHLNSKNVLQIMHELDINDMQYFQRQYVDVIQSEHTAKKVANSQQLTPQEVAGMVGHFGNLEQTQAYTHYSPQPNPIDVFSQQAEQIRQQQEQLQKQQEQIAELLKIAERLKQSS